MSCLALARGVGRGRMLGRVLEPTRHQANVHWFMAVIKTNNKSFICHAYLVMMTSHNGPQAGFLLNGVYKFNINLF